MELRSCALGESGEVLPGIERIPRARRIRTRKVNMIRIVKTSVDGEDLRDGNRECLPFAAIAAVVFLLLTRIFQGKTGSRIRGKTWGVAGGRTRSREREKSRSSVRAAVL